MTYLNMTQARAHLPEVLDRVERGEEITITRHGRPAAVLLRPDAVRARRAEHAIERAGAIGEIVSAARDVPLPAPTLTEERAQELIDAVRAARDR